jgi:hypothetical protein
MPNIFFPSQTLSAEELFGKGHPALANLPRNNSLQCNALTANMPYCLDEKDVHPDGKIITQTLGNLPENSRNNLMCTIDTFGDLTPTLAAFYDKHLAFFNLQNSAGLVGAGATASETRLTGFHKALKNYQSALQALHSHKGTGRGPSATNAALKGRVRATYSELQLQYHAELNKLASPGSLGKNRGNALASADRGVTLAQRRGRGIHVASTTQAVQISRMATGVAYAGKGLIALDAGIRINGVHNTYKQGGNWQREAAVQAAGFGFGGAVGVKTGIGVVAGLTAIGLGLTPVGWVVIIGIGVAAGFGAGYATDYGFQKLTAWIYDRGSN